MKIAFEKDGNKLELNMKDEISVSDRLVGIQSAYDMFERGYSDEFGYPAILRDYYFTVAMLTLLTDYSNDMSTADESVALIDKYGIDFTKLNIKPLKDMYSVYKSKVNTLVNKSSADKMYDAVTQLVESLRDMLVTDENREAVRVAMAQLASPEVLKSLTAMLGEIAK